MIFLQFFCNQFYSRQIFSHDQEDFDFEKTSSDFQTEAKQ